MKIVSAVEMAGIDNAAINSVGIPAAVLMENAGLSVVSALERKFSDLSSKKVLIICGSGNNGGDGMVAARHLANRGVSLQVAALFSPGSSLTEEALINYRILENMKIAVEEIKDSSDISLMARFLESSDIVVDAIFGTGLKREVDGIQAESIKMMNSSGKWVAAVDIPSGIAATTGRIMGTAVKADITVTMGLPKWGLLLFPGANFAGEVVVSDIGIPGWLLLDEKIKGNLIEPSLFRGALPERPIDANKGTCGKVLVVGGSAGYTGAAALAAEAALRSGAGLVYLALPGSLNSSMEAKLTEVITCPLPENKEKTLCSTSLPALKALAGGVDVVAIGPGLGRSPETVEMILKYLDGLDKPAVIDADALYALSQKKLKKFKNPSVLTPHFGEMARLAGVEIEKIKKDPVGISRDFVSRTSSVLVLKGAHSLVTLPDGRVFLNTTGNPGMATAGSGDVLTGMIAGFIAQGANIEMAAAAGVYLHGAAGDEAALEYGIHGVIAGDITKNIGKTMKRFWIS
ncbi:MAG: NAD(P)H-hydrate dehydratase [Firmicutes bacterium]|nr:NAD(P)H-hydrate dehydratase [Bacillota bacterium]